MERPLHKSALLTSKQARTGWQRAQKALLAGAVAIALAFGVSVYTNSRAAEAIGHTTGKTVATRSLGVTLPAELSPTERLTRLQARLQILIRQGLTLHTSRARSSRRR